MSTQDRPGWNPPEGPSFEPTTSAEVISSAGPRRSRLGKGVAIAAIGIGALGVAGTAYASTASPSPAPSAGQNGPAGQPGYGMGGGMMRGDHDGDRGPGGPGMGGLRMGAGMAIHGTFVTPKQGGGYQTVATQRGKVTAVSSTSLTVSSVDGYQQTYSVTSTTMVDAQRDGIASVKVGDEVGVMAIVEGSTQRAVAIMDRTQMGAARGQLGPRPGGAASPAPTKTA